MALPNWLPVRDQLADTLCAHQRIGLNDQVFLHVVVIGFGCGIKIKLCLRGGSVCRELNWHDFNVKVVSDGWIGRIEVK